MPRFACPDCGYLYDEERGDPREGWPAEAADHLALGIGAVLRGVSDTTLG